MNQVFRYLAILTLLALPAEEGRSQNNLFERAEAAEQAGQLDVAIDLYTSFLKEEPANALAFKNRGRAYLSLVDSQSALQQDKREELLLKSITDSSKANELQPRFSAALNNRGLAKQRLGKSTEALEDFGLANQADPSLFQPVFNRASLFYSLNRSEEALTDMNRAIEMKPGDSNLFINRARILASLQKFAEASNDLDFANSLNPNNVEQLFELGKLRITWIQQARIDLGEQRSILVDAALRDLKKVKEIKPQMVENHHNLGVVYVFKNELDSARTCYEDALKLDPKFSASKLGLANLYDRLGDNEKRDALLQEAIDLDPKSTNAHASRIVFLAKKETLSPLESERLVQSLDAYIDQVSDNPEAYDIRARTLYRLGKKKESEEDYKKAALNSGSLSFFLIYDKSDSYNDLLRKIYLAESRWQDAIRFLDEYLEKIGSQPGRNRIRSLTNRAWFHARNNNYYQSIIDLDEAISIASKPDNLVSADLPSKSEAEADSTKIIESLSKTREETIQEARRILAKPDCSVISLELDQELLSITTARMGPYLLPAGVTKKVEESRKVIHSMTVSKEWKAEVELKSVIDIWIAIIEPAVRFSFEKSVGRTYGIETTETRGVELTGPVEAPGIWVEYRDVFRTGKATIKLGDKIIVLPFQFRIDFDITSSYAKPGEAAKQ